MAHSAALHEHENANDEKERQQDGQQAGEPAGLWCFVVVVDTLVFQELLVGIAEDGGTGGGELASVAQCSRQHIGDVVNRDIVYLAQAYLREKFGIRELLGVLRRNKAWPEHERKSTCGNEPHCPLGELLFARLWSSGVGVVALGIERVLAWLAIIFLR